MVAALYVGWVSALLLLMDAGCLFRFVSIFLAPSSFPLSIFFPGNQSGVLACICFALVFIAVGIAWPNIFFQNNLAVYEV